ncbi:hypothetical protein MHU86_21521 [Fragilaria crotonensis]|nr:hypothetical protein MHU86_21521 [Fragilaria crotonensis]
MVFPLVNHQGMLGINPIHCKATQDGQCLKTTCWRKTPLSKSRGVVRALQRTLTKQLNTALAYIEEQEEVPFFLNQHSDVKKTRVINKARLARLVIPCVVVVLATFTGLLPTRLFRRSNSWDRLEERHLGGRQCVMNLFVDKHEENEFNPDFDPSADKEHALKPQPVEGTYRTKGQVEVINRFISSVAAAFRPNVSLQQHVVFAGTRDGGHLAQEALKHWPPRGTYRTQLHVFADRASDDLDYETVQRIEDRFKGNEEDVHIYDFFGNVAGNQNSEDDDAVDEHLKQQKQQQHQEKEPEYDTLPDLKKVVFQNDDDEVTVIPYLHVDGTSMAMQMSILSQAENLLQDRKIVVVGLEHSPDLDINDLIEFFRKVNYKTFMLGLRQLTRIDNLCPEILDNVMQHPTLASSNRNNWLTGNSMLSMPPFLWPCHGDVIARRRWASSTCTISSPEHPVCCRSRLPMIVSPT